jgi:hypothetical protein
MKNRKRCSACKNEVLVSGFNMNNSNKDKLQGECRTCQNERARKRNRKKAKAKKSVKEQVKKDKINNYELQAKAIFLNHLAGYMADEDADYKVLANRAGYDPRTVSSYLNGPEKVSERFISQVSKRIPALSREWIIYKMGVTGKMPEPEPKTVIPSLSQDLYVVVVDDELLEPGVGPLQENEISEAVDSYLNEQEVTPNECVIEVFKLVKVGYELNIVHDLTIYSPIEDGR